MRLMKSSWGVMPCGTVIKWWYWHVNKKNNSSTNHKCILDKACLVRTCFILQIITIQYSHAYVCTHFDDWNLFISVASAATQSCLQGRNIRLEGPSAFLASVDILTHRYGGIDCPWQITASPGQRVNVTLYNFARYKPPPDTGSDTSQYITNGACYELGDIIERGGLSQRLTLCKHLDRKTHVYTSQTNSISIQMKTDRALSEYYFLLKYEGKILNIGTFSVYLGTYYYCI